MISNYDKQNIEAILNGYGDWFTANLLRLIAKADGDNRKLLYGAFPEEVDAVCQYYFKQNFNERGF